MKRWIALAFAAPAFVCSTAQATLDVEILDGDQVTATIGAAAEVDAVRFRVPKDAVVTVRAKSAKNGPSLHVAVKDADDAQPGVGPKDGRSATFAGILVQKSGVFTVEVSAQDGTSVGDFSVSVSWKSRGSFGGRTAIGPGSAVDVPFAADAGAAATFSVKRFKKSTATPSLNGLTRPDASTAPLSGASAKTVLATGGDYALSVAGGAAGGDVVASIKVKPPKPSKRKIGLTTAVVGAQDYAHASVVEPSGGTVAVPPIAQGQPGAPISGASVTIPAGALPAGASIVIATAPPIAGPSGTQGGGPTVFFGPEGMRFDHDDSTKRARVTIPFDPAFSGDPSVLRIYTRDANGVVTLVPQPPAYEIDLATDTVTFETSHFSSFAALAPAGTRPTPDFFSIADIADPQDVCDALDPNVTSPTRVLYFVAEGDGKTVGAMRLPSVGTQLVHETWVGGGTQTGDATPRASFQFVDPVKTVFATLGGALWVGTTTQIFIVDSQSGTVMRVAGKGGTPGDSGDGGAALSAVFTSIRNLIVDSSGRILVADEGAHRIRSIDTTSTFSVFAYAGVAGGTAGIGLDGGSPASTKFVGPSDISFAKSGGVYVADGARIRHINPGQAPVNVTIAGDPSGAKGSTGDGLKPSAATFQSIAAITPFVDPQNSNADVLVVADAGDHVIRLVDFTRSVVTLVAGTHGTAGFNGDTGFAPGLLDGPVGVIAAGTQATICDRGNGRLRVAPIP